MSKFDQKSSKQFKSQIRVDRQGFIIKEKRFFPLGFNYWPRDMAVYLWPENNSKAIARDIQVIAQLGGTCIRMFIRWEDLELLLRCPNHLGKL